MSQFFLLLLKHLPCKHWYQNTHYMIVKKNRIKAAEKTVGGTEDAQAWRGPTISRARTRPERIGCVR